MNKPFISYAQNGEDVVIWRCLSDVEGGYFVDVGAADPVGYSSTYCLYQAGWRGINIEPEPNFARALKALRPADTTVATAVGSEVGELELLRVSGTGLSTFNLERAAEFVASGFEYEPIKVPVTTLDILLAAHATAGQQIHLLKIDVEGFERQALNGLDLNVWRPWVVVVEATEPMSEIRNHDDWEALLTDNGYQCKLFDGLNRYYLAEEHEERSNRLDHGP